MRYTFEYRSRFIAGVCVAFLVAVLNGISLTAFIPLFDALGDRSERFTAQFSKEERDLMDEALLYTFYYYYYPDLPEAEKAYVPPVPEEIGKDLANNLIPPLQSKYITRTGLEKVELLRLNYMIIPKLRLNAAGYTPFQIVAFACGVMLPMFLFKLIFILISVRLIARTGYLAVRNIREDLYESVQRLPLTHFYRERSGELVSRMINDVEVVAAVISNNLRDAITNVFIIITHVALLAWLNVELLLVSLVVVPIMLSPVTLFTRKIRKSVTKSQELLAGLHGHLQESISGVRVIRSAAMEEYETGRFRKVNERLYWRTFKQIFYLKMGPVLVEMNSVLVALGVFALGGQYLNQTEFTTGQFMTFFIVLLSIIRPIIQLSGMYAKIQAASAAGERLFELVDGEPESVDPVNPLPVERLRGEIKFENVCFTYPGTDKEVLHNINLNVPIGSTVALVGESGGGKSTMMDLMARFFLPTSGRILLDGQDLRDFRAGDHRRRIGIVTQEIFLFYGTIFQNIAYGSPDHDESEVEKAARLAHAHDFISEFYEGYHTLVGNRGMTLSGGQRQRISIARALLHDPEILILDEATSALDTESERLVQQALERLFQNRTTFVIAHRLSTVEKADMIVVISDGRIVDQGTHTDLMARGGLYSRLQEIGRKVDDFAFDADEQRARIQSP
ncbi:MAG: ABC transporter ATP-binding protein [Leptospiraceae bacterium]|nr:ABC transporter ATP-binding protein [Leptospiraceae bacterium]